MTGETTDLVIQTSIHRKNRWILIPVEISSRCIVEMVLDTGTARSRISEGVRQALAELKLLEPYNDYLFLLRDLRIQGQSVPDLKARLGPQVTQVGAQGLLGLDFLSQFDDIHFHVPSLRLTLSHIRPDARIAP